MTDHICETTETLLGRQLLGHATEAELGELDLRLRASPELRRAMELLDLTRTAFERSPLGEDLSMDRSKLPEYECPEKLARSLRRWNRIGAALSAVAASLLLALAVLGMSRLDTGLTPLQLAALGTLAALGLGAVWIVSARRRRGAPYARTAWAELVDQFERQRRRYQGRPAAIAMVASALFAPVLLILSGFVSEPFSKALAYSSFACVAFATHVAVRRWRVRSICGA